MMRKPAAAVTTLSILFLVEVKAGEPDCVDPPRQRLTNDFILTASADQGAQGDIVAIETSLQVEQLHPRLAAMAIVGCYDESQLELLDEPLHTEQFEQLAYLSYFFRLGGPTGPHRAEGGSGFILSADLRVDRAELLLREQSVVPLVTMFFRLIGSPGEVSVIRFCDNEFRYTEPPESRACLVNQLYYQASFEDQLVATSDRHLHGEIRILDGPPTHPDVPSLPPLARVYPEPPTPETADIHFELSGRVVRPGDTDVPLDLFVTSNFEFSGYSLALNYRSKYLDFVRVNEHIRPGALTVAQEQGYFALVMINSRRRVGVEGQRVRIATLYFNIKDDAAEAEDVAPWFAPTPFVSNWLAIRHEGGLAGDLPVTAEVEPLATSVRLLRVQTRPTLLGDVNLDYNLDLSDALSLLGALFQRHDPVLCPDAADFNADQRIDVSDAVAILIHLFVEARPSVDSAIDCTSRD